MRRAKILKNRLKFQYFERRIAFSCSVALVLHPTGCPKRKALGTHFCPIVPKTIFPDPHMILWNPNTVFNRTVAAKRGFLEEGSGDAFLTYRSKSNFSRPLCNPCQADRSFEQNGCSQKGVLRGRLLGRIFVQSFQKRFSRTPIRF